MLKRHAVQVLAEAGVPTGRIAEQVGIPERSVRRIVAEPPVDSIDDRAERERRNVGRPSKVEAFREFVAGQLTENPELLTVELLRRARKQGYTGGKSALYTLVRELRPTPVKPMTRFEGLPGEFSQHDFGEVVVTYDTGETERVHFFASRMKYSRYAAVTVVPNQRTEALCRALVEHFESFGGVPLLAVFDRPRTVALKWKKNGDVTEWNPVFAQVMFELGVSAELCWPHRPNQKGSVENLVGWVKGSFFKQRRFIDRDDMLWQLSEWLRETNEERPSRATNVIPAERLREERPRMRHLKTRPEHLALRYPIVVSAVGEVEHDGCRYDMPPDAIGIPGTLYQYADRVEIVAGRHRAAHRRGTPEKPVQSLPAHRAARIAAVAGRRGQHYARREQLLDLCGAPMLRLLTEIVHRKPRGWYRDIEHLHDLLQHQSTETLIEAVQCALDVGRPDVATVDHMVATLIVQQGVVQ
ncbi:MAG: IS21 family transposase [bacterium]